MSKASGLVEPSASTTTGATAQASRAAEPGGYRPGYERVAEQILDLIGRLHLAPGDRIPTEHELAAQLGASRTMVREAIRILSALGHVRAQKGRGLYVGDDQGVLRSLQPGGHFVPTDLDQIFMLFEFRRVQETAASRLAATRATPMELRTIETAVQTCRHGFLSSQAEVFNQADDDFHLAVAAASHNQFLVAAVRDARRLQRQCAIGHSTLDDHTERAVAEHVAIYQAIRDGQPEAAAENTATHLDNTLEQYRREIQQRLWGASGSATGPNTDRSPISPPR